MAVVWTTYRNADGTEVGGEYAWVTDLDFWDESDLDQPVEVLKETWELVSSETIRLVPTGWCDVHESCCHGEHDENGDPA